MTVKDLSRSVLQQLTGVADQSFDPGIWRDRLAEQARKASLGGT